MPTLPHALLGLLLFTLASPSSAAAQPIDWWMVLPAGEADHTGIERRAAEQLVSSLKDRRVAVLSLHQARDAFEKSSREPTALDPTDIDLLAQEAYEAVRQVAFGNRQAAARRVSQVMQRAERAMETLNRETKNARYVLDACLALVRSTMSRGDREGALAEATRCRRIVPDVTPSELMHPPSVIGVLAEADDQLRRMQIGQLTVESAPDAGCSVYLNGRHLGTTPFKLRRAAAGEYRVQVECGERAGRVHTVQLGEQPVNLRVDTILDQSVRSQPTLELRYARPKAAQQRLLRDAQEVTKQTGAYEAVIVTATDDQRVRLRRISLGADRVLADVSVVWRDNDFDADDLRDGLDSLLAGRIERDEAPAAAPAPAPLASARAQGAATTEPHKSPWDRRTKQLRIGLPLGAAGAAGLIAGWALYADAKHKRERRDALPPSAAADPGNASLLEEILARTDAYAHARAKPAIAFAGGALGAAAMPWLLPDARGVPWYGWAVGALGVGAAAVGFWQLAGHGACAVPVPDACLRSDDHLPLLSVSFATALPLLAVPLTFALRMPFAKHGVDARLGATPLTAGAALHLTGSF